MFIDRTDLLLDNPAQLHYGIAVMDADADGAFEFFVTGFGFPNQLLKWNGSALHNVARLELADPHRQAIGVAAADIDADGHEEIYILNTDTFAGQKTFADRLFDLTDGYYVDLFELPHNQDVLNLSAGRSVAALDRIGSGHYGFFVANYGGPLRLYELNEDGKLIDIAPATGIAVTTGGRALLPISLVSDYTDVFVGTENASNLLFRNNGDGTFDEIAGKLGLRDSAEHVRGVTSLDIGTARFALVYGNWEGPHRLFLPSSDGRWDDVAPSAMANPSRIRTVIAADFDNDGNQEIFFNNIGQPNRLFGFRGGEWVMLSAGDAIEPGGMGTGAAVADLDGDGRLELLIAHGESALQPLSLYHAVDRGYNYLRVLPLSRYGAPARGAVVTVVEDQRVQHRVVDAGSGYLCQMEPVAHFGLGDNQNVREVRIQWPDGHKLTIQQPAINQLLRVSYPV